MFGEHSRVTRDGNALPPSSVSAASSLFLRFSRPLSTTHSARRCQILTPQLPTEMENKDDIRSPNYLSKPLTSLPSWTTFCIDVLP